MSAKKATAAPAVAADVTAESSESAGSKLREAALARIAEADAKRKAAGVEEAAKQKAAIAEAAKQKQDEEEAKTKAEEEAKKTAKEEVAKKKAEEEAALKAAEEKAEKAKKAEEETAGGDGKRRVYSKVDLLR